MRVLGKTGLFGADRRGLGRALAVRGVRGGAAKRGKTGGEQWDKSAKPMGLCPIALFSRVLGFRPSVFAASSMGLKTDLQLNQNSAKNQAVPPWASASSAGPLFALLLSSKYVQNIDSFSPVLTRLYL